jgi:hypothetical protein
MQELAEMLSNAFIGVAAVFDDISNHPIFGKIVDLAKFLTTHMPNLYTIIKWLSGKGTEATSAGLAPSSANAHLSQLQGPSNAKKAAAAEAAAKKRASALVKSQKDNTAELKRQAAIKKQNGLFDLQQIGIVAALKGQISEDERNKLKLQLALLQGNDEEATRLSQKIANSIDATGKLAAYLKTLPDAKNPFAGWKGYLDEVELQAKRIAAFSVTTPSGTTGSSMVPLPPSFKPSIPMPPRAEGGATVIKVEIDGKEVATAVQNQNNSGNKTGFSRLGDFLTL